MNRGVKKGVREGKKKKKKERKKERKRQRQREIKGDISRRTKRGDTKDPKEDKRNVYFVARERKKINLIKKKWVNDRFTPSISHVAQLFFALPISGKIDAIGFILK